MKVTIARLYETYPAAVRVEIAGSARRGADSVKDLDVIAAATDTAALAQALAGVEVMETASPAGPTAAPGGRTPGTGGRPRRS